MVKWEGRETLNLEVACSNPSCIKSFTNFRLIFLILSLNRAAFLFFFSLVFANRSFAGAYNFVRISLDFFFVIQVSIKNLMHSSLPAVLY